jgi:hypothetical protein
MGRHPVAVETPGGSGRQGDTLLHVFLQTLRLSTVRITPPVQFLILAKHRKSKLKFSYFPSVPPVNRGSSISLLGQNRFLPNPSQHIHNSPIL